MVCKLKFDDYAARGIIATRLPLDLVPAALQTIL